MRNRHVFIRLTWNGETVIIPELTTSVRIQHSNPPHFHHIVASGPVAVPSFRSVKTILLENTQFWQRWIDRFIEGGWTPRQYADWLTALRDSREPAQLTIESDLETLQQNLLVLIDFESWEVRHGEENDIHYSLVMYEHELHDVKVPGVIYSGDGAIVEAPLPPRSDLKPESAGVYTVVAGDSLWRITQRHLGADQGHRWRELYGVPENQAVIHARGNQDLIFPGQRLVLPEEWG